MFTGLPAGGGGAGLRRVPEDRHFLPQHDVVPARRHQVHQASAEPDSLAVLRCVSCSHVVQLFGLTAPAPAPAQMSLTGDFRQRSANFCACNLGLNG